MLLEFADRGSLEQAIQSNRFRRKGGAGLDMVTCSGSCHSLSKTLAYHSHSLHSLAPGSCPAFQHHGKHVAA
jgi:hypothetical protein